MRLVCKLRTIPLVSEGIIGAGHGSGAHMLEDMQKRSDDSLRLASRAAGTLKLASMGIPQHGDSQFDSL